MCNAKATVARIEVEGDIRYVLNDFSDDHKHPGGMAHVIAEDMKFEMCKKVEVNPEKPVSEARNAVIIEYAKKHEDNPDLWAEVIANIGDYDAVDKRLLRARQKVIGNAPKNRNEFDPTKIIENVAESTPLQFTQCSITNTEVSVKCEECNYHYSSESILRLYMKDHRWKNRYL